MIIKTAILIPLHLLGLWLGYTCVGPLMACVFAQTPQSQDPTAATEDPAYALERWRAYVEQNKQDSLSKPARARVAAAVALQSCVESRQQLMALLDAGLSHPDVVDLKREKRIKSHAKEMLRVCYP